MASEGGKIFRTFENLEATFQNSNSTIRSDLPGLLPALGHVLPLPAGVHPEAPGPHPGLPRGGAVAAACADLPLRRDLQQAAGEDRGGRAARAQETLARGHRPVKTTDLSAFHVRGNPAGDAQHPEGQVS